jgi:hypothetical protein
MQTYTPESLGASLNVPLPAPPPLPLPPSHPRRCACASTRPGVAGARDGDRGRIPRAEPPPHEAHPPLRTRMRRHPNDSSSGGSSPYLPPRAPSGTGIRLTQAGIQSPLLLPRAHPFAPPAPAASFVRKRCPRL